MGWQEDAQCMPWEALSALHSIQILPCRAGVSRHLGSRSGSKCLQRCGPSVSVGLLGSGMSSTATEQFEREWVAGFQHWFVYGRGT